MNFRQLIIRNLRGNFRTYAAYFISSAFAALVFYVFSLLLFHPQLQENLSTSATLSDLSKIGLVVALVVIALLSLLFLWYTFVIFLKRRKRDLAIYLFLGIQEKDLQKLLFLENALLGTLATTTGIGLGILITKLLLMIFQNVMHLTQSLRFMVPLAGFGLTFGVYFLIFVFISFFSTRTLHGEQIISLIKENEKPRPEPKSHWTLAVLGLIVLFAGYGSVFFFSLRADSMFPLMLGVLLTIAGTMLCFHQFSIVFLKGLKKRASFLQGTKMLTISEWIFRMRDNAAMYSLIAISTSVAFVGISIMMAIGSEAFSSIQGISVAYVFHNVSLTEEPAKSKVGELNALLEEKGYQPELQEVQILSTFFDSTQVETVNDPYFMANSFSVIRESDYRKLMAQIGEEPETIADDQLLELSSNYSRRKQLLAVDKKERQASYPLELGDGMASSLIQETTVIHSPSMISLNYYGLSVVTDRTFEKWQELQRTNDYSTMSSIIWLDYPEWANDPELIETINRQFDQYNKESEEKATIIHEELGEEKIAKMSDEEWTQALADVPPYLSYQSRYHVFQESRQGNGLILTITVLLGTVFFTFSASIIYFRLFADLEKDGAYHRSLHILGVTPKERHKVLHRQLQIMYFLPTFVAMIHFAVAMTALRILVELPVWQFYGQIVACYLVFQVLFYIVCQQRYTVHIDRYADPT